MAQVIDQETLPDMKADARARLAQIASLCDDLSMTLESEPDVIHTFLSSQAQSIRKAATEWAGTKAKRGGR